jgi:hypothetical protein
MEPDMSIDGEGALTDDPADSPSRRRLLKLAAVGLGGAGLAVTTGVQPAEAAHQAEDLGIGLTNGNAGTASTFLNTTGAIAGAQVAFQSGNTYSGPGSSYDAALSGWAGVSGTSNVGVYAFAEKAGGAALAAWGRSGSIALRLRATDFATAPTSNTYQLGDVVSAVDGLWLCVEAGTPGTWRKLAGPATAGAFHAITPHRVYDSRHSSKLHNGDSRTITIANGINASGAVDAANLVPAGATAISVNVTVTQTEGGGNVTVYPAGVALPLASTANWFATGQTLANSVQVKISAGRQVIVHCSGTATHVVLDVGGYYL